MSNYSASVPVKIPAPSFQLRALAELELRRRRTPAASTQPEPLPELRGANRAAFDSTGPEVVISGPTGTGKTFAWLTKLHRLAIDYPGVRLLLLRKTREALTESALVTYERDVLGAGHPLLAGAPARENRKRYVYPNGSEIIVAGLTQSNKDQRAKVMGQDYDAIYVPECTELTSDEWQKLGTRLRDGRLPYRQLAGDCNPDSPSHWLWARHLSKLTEILWGRHEDNPKLWDGANWTVIGAEYRERLARMTGHMRERLFIGNWVQAEGVIFDTWSEAGGGNVT